MEVSRVWDLPGVFSVDFLTEELLVLLSVTGRLVSVLTVLLVSADLVAGLLAVVSAGRREVEVLILLSDKVLPDSVRTVGLVVVDFVTGLPVVASVCRREVEVVILPSDNVLVDSVFTTGLEISRRPYVVLPSDLVDVLPVCEFPKVRVAVRRESLLYVLAYSSEPALRVSGRE